MTDIIFLIAVFFLAALYSSVGHGGASGYLALMAIFGFSPAFMRPTALVLNIFVSLISFLSFYRGGYFKFSLLWPFLLGSIPMAFLGGHINVNPRIYKIILGLFLLIAIMRMFLRRDYQNESKGKLNIPLAIVIGGIIGFFSGLIGIGGGIILSPVIILLKWGDIKQTAAVSAAFIFFNSVSGLVGQISSGIHLAPQTFYMLAFAMGGGLLGSWIGSNKATNLTLKYFLSFVLTFAVIKLLFL